MKESPYTYFKFNNIGEWISCYIDDTGRKWKDIKVRAFNKDEYHCGFHSFMNYDQACEVFKNIYQIYSNFVLCECRTKFRLIYGIENYEIDDVYYETEICVSRGMKILKEVMDCYSQ